MTLPKLDTARRVGDQAFEAIHAAIMNGAFPAGRRLQIRDLAGELGISVMPVREAIKRLEELGLVENVPYRGAEVKRFTRQELLSLYDVRKLLEIEASVRGAAQFPEANVALLMEIWQQMSAAINQGRVVEYLDLDEALLVEVYNAAGNPVLLDTIGLLWRRCRTYKIFGARQEYESGQISKLLSHQEELITAVQARDGERAGQITAESLDAAIRRIRRGLPGSWAGEQLRPPG